MANHYLFDKQTISDLRLVIEDKESEFGDLKILPLNRRGKITYDFVLDVNEIGKYCFPIDIYKSNYDLEEFEKIVDSQIAYNDVFKLHHSKPIIFREYEKELKGTYEYFRSLSENIRNQTNSELFKELWNNYLNISNQSDDDTKFKDFAVALSLAYFSFGVDRLKEIKVIYESEYKKDDLLGALIDYQLDKSSIETVFGKVRRKHPNVGEPALRRDIISIDKVYFLNKFFINNSIARRIIYFSSATKTKSIIEAFEENKNNKKSNFCNFYPWRTPIQIYLYLIFRDFDDKNAVIKTEETLQNLRALREQIIDLVDFGGKLFKRGQSSDKIRETLAIKRENYIRKLDNIEGLKLVDIVSLSGIRNEENQDAIDRNLKKYSPELKKQITSFLLETINLTPENIDKENDVDSLLIQLQTDIKLSDVIPIQYANNDDLITNCYDAFPFLLYIENTDFKNILESLYKYWIEYYNKSQHRKLNTFDKYQILDIINDFLFLDKELIIRNRDYYTVSAMLHLVNPNKNSDTIAKEYIEKLEVFDKLSNNFNLLYIKATVLRRNNDYLESINLCNTYRHEDFRFGYCRALALMGLVFEKIKLFQKYKNEIKEAVTDLIYAFEEIGKSEFKYKENFQAAICSNIVYLAALYYQNSEEEIHSMTKSFYVETAETYLKKLKELMPKKRWDFCFPDFYHSEAFFEYTTIEAYMKNMQSEEFKYSPENGWEKRLKSALRDIRKAIRFSVVSKKRKFYEDLKEKLVGIKNRW